MRVNEIFYSLQGEGRHAGTPAVFVRLAGCNLRCPFCDTQHESFVEMTEADIVEQVLLYPARVVVITGGEPTLQLNVTLTRLLHEAGFSIHLETNGTRPLAEDVEIDWITCSPKEGGVVRIQRMDELKVVFMGQDMAQYDRYEVQERRLQPLDSGDERQNLINRQRTVEYVLAHPEWRLSLQAHKLLAIQ